MGSKAQLHQLIFHTDLINQNANTTKEQGAADMVVLVSTTTRKRGTHQLHAP